MTRLEQHYSYVVAPTLNQKINFAPKISKIVVHATAKIASDKKAILPVLIALERITGQKAKLNKTRKSVSGFNTRKGYGISATVTLRSHRMFAFLDILLNTVLVNQPTYNLSTNRHGNCSFGIRDYTIFSAIREDHEAFKLLQGLDITIVTNTDDPIAAKLLIQSFRFP